MHAYSARSAASKSVGGHTHSPSRLVFLAECVLIQGMKGFTSAWRVLWQRWCGSLRVLGVEPPLWQCACSWGCFIFGILSQVSHWTACQLLGCRGANLSAALGGSFPEHRSSIRRCLLEPVILWQKLFLNVGDPACDAIFVPSYTTTETLHSQVDPGLRHP